MCSRQNWTGDEDAYLSKLVDLSQKMNWNQIASSMNAEFLNKNRTSKQCRQRFINYSAFCNEKTAQSDWTNEELSTLYNQFEKQGASWTKIAHLLPGKSQNSIKNKFYGTMRKTVRKMNAISRGRDQKMKKKLRFQSVLRAVEAAETFRNLSNELKQQSFYLRDEILSIVCAGVEKMEIQSTCILINRLNRFNLMTRSFRSIKPKKHSESECKKIISNGENIIEQVMNNYNEDKDEKVEQKQDFLNPHKITEYNHRQNRNNIKQIKSDSPFDSTCPNMTMVCEAKAAEQFDISRFLSEMNCHLPDEFTLF